MGILGEGRMLRMELPGERKHWGRPKGGLWMWGDRTWQWLKLQRRIQKIGTNDERSQKKKKLLTIIQIGLLQCKEKLNSQ